MPRRTRRLEEDLAGLRTKYAACCQQLEAKTAESETWKAQAGAADRHAGDLITRTRERDQAVRDLHATEDQLAEARRRAAPKPPVHDELWSLLDWSLWGAGMGDVLREPMADAMTGAVTDQQRADALRVMAAWEKSGRTPVGRWRYESQKRRIKRLAAASAGYRAELSAQRTVMARLTEQLFDAVGYQPAERALLTTEVAG